MPGLWALKHYRRSWLAKDIAAGLVVTSLLVPAGMSYAVAAGLPAITGLYATIAPLLAYALFGPSRIMVVGPDSALAAMIAAAVVSRAANDPERATALASVLAILTGVFCVLAGLFRAGFVTDLVSKPVRVGYMNGIALTVLVAQLPKLLGFSGGAGNLGDALSGLVRGVISGRTNRAALLIGATCLLFIHFSRKVRPRFPGVLAAVVASTLAVSLLGLRNQIAVVGMVPWGLPLPALPRVAIGDVRDMAVAALGIALVSYADMSVLSRTFAARNGYRVDSNRELVGLGIANISSGFFRGFPVTSSSSRTPVAEAAGSKTQLTGVVGALAIVTLLVAAPSLLQNLPTTALAAIVVAAALLLFDVRSLALFRRVRPSDFILSILAFLAVATLGVLWGILVSIALSVLDVLRRAWHPHDAVLGRAAGIKGYHDVTRYPAARQVPGLLLFRWDAPLFFANADTFRARVIELVDSATQPVLWVVIASEPITDVDTTAAEMLQELDTELAARGAELAFAEMKDPVKDRLKRYELHATIGHEYFFPTLGVAVKTFIDRFGVEWNDWESKPNA